MLSLVSVWFPNCHVSAVWVLLYTPTDCEGCSCLRKSSLAPSLSTACETHSGHSGQFNHITLPSTLVVSRAHHINILSMCHHNQTIFCIPLATLQGETLFKRAGVTWPYTSCVAAPWVYVDMLPRYVLCELCVYIPTWFHMSVHIVLAQSNACCIDACSMHACMHVWTYECMNGCMDDYGILWMYACVKVYSIHLYTCCRMLLSLLVYTDAVDVVQKRQPHHDSLQHGYKLPTG